MNKPESVEDVWPHTETVLFLMDSNHCFGSPVSQIMDDISRCEHLGNGRYHENSELSADCHRFSRDKIGKINEIVPNSLIFAHCDLVIETDLWVYLRGNSIPKGSDIVILLDESTYDAEERIENIPRSIETASCKEDVLEAAERYFNRICPECQGEPARNWVLTWKQQVYQKVEN